MPHEQWTGVGLKGGREHDALSGWRRLLSFRPGERKAAKTQFNRRVRHRPIEFEDVDAGPACPWPEGEGRAIALNASPGLPKSTAQVRVA